MTAPQTPPPLPVVACGVDQIDIGRIHWYVDDLPHVAPALAVPLAIWTDEVFRAAVYARAATTCNQWDYPSLPDYLAAIAAELRARAGDTDA